MIVLVVAALLTIIVLNILLMPLMLDKKKQGWALLVFITISAMGIYIWRGSPDIPARPALFETQGANFEKRAAIQKELDLAQELAESPDDIGLMLSLGSVRLKNGKLEQAIAILTTAHVKDPAHKKISLKLGAAHYAAALSAFFLEENKVLAKEHFDKALEIAPADAPYREQLLKDIKAFQEDAF